MRLSFRLVGFALCIVAVVVFFATVVPALLAEDPLGPQAPPAPAPTILLTDVNPYGANFFLEWEPEQWKVEKTFEMAHNAGIGWVKQDFPWDSLQLSPGADGYWNDNLNQSTWDKYDRIVKLARGYGMEVIARLDRPPSWTRQENSLPERPPDDLNLYGNFVYDVVKHFKGQVHYYQIWNEPNIYPEWGDQPPDAAAYVHLLQIAYKRAKEADPTVVVMSAPLAQTMENSARNESDVKYLQEMYAAGARPYFDVLLANAYGFAFPPEDPPSPDRLNFQRVVLLRQVMEKNGDTGKPIWFNEFGWDAAPDSFAPKDLPWGRVTEQKQAQYTVDAIRYARAHWPWAGVFNIWYFRQPTLSDSADYYFRMVDAGFTPRLVYNAVRDAATAQGVAGPGTYAVTDPAVAYSGTWNPVMTASAIGGVARTSNTPGDSITITFRGGGLTLRVQRSPNAGQVYLTVDGREANNVPDRFQGRSVLSLNGSDQEAPIDLPIASDLGPGQHVLRLVVGPTAGPEHGLVQVLGFQVLSLDRFLTLYRAGVVVGIIGALGGTTLFATRIIFGNRPSNRP